MDKDSLLDGWNVARNLAGRAGGKIKANAQSFRENIANDYDKYKEIGILKEKCRNLLQEADKKILAANAVLEHEYRQFQQLVTEIEAGSLHTYVQYCHYLQVISPQGVVGKESIVKPVFSKQNIWQEAGNAVAGAVAAGAAAGTVTLGLVTAVGTAGTGTAISALSGAAYVNATLAALGGGSVAAGGLGMAGGLAVLGAAVAAPAAAVMGYFLDKNIKLNYTEAEKRFAKATEYANNIEKASARADILSHYLKLKTREIYAFRYFFDDMLNVAAGAEAYGDSENYLPILNDAATTLIAYIQLPLVNENEVNYDFENYLQELQDVSAACRRQFYGYILKQSPRYRRLLEAVREQDLAEHQDDFARWIDIIAQGLARMEEKLDDMHVDTQARFDQVDAALLDVKTSLTVLGEDLRRLQEETVSRLSAVADNQEETEQLLSSFSDSMSKRLLEATAIRQARYYAEYKKQLCDAFGHSWEKLQPRSQKFLISARMLYQELSSLGNQLDFSGVCILAAKALENELHLRFYNEFVQYLQSKYPLAVVSDKWPSFLCRTDHWGQKSVIPEGRFTLGMIPFACGVRSLGHINDVRYERDMDVVTEYGRTLFIPDLTEQEIRDVLRTIGRDTDKIVQKYRNPAAHTNALQQADAKDCLDFLLEVERVFIWMMEHFRN